MAAPWHSSLILLLYLSYILHVLLSAGYAQSAPAGPISITSILDKAGQYTNFLRLLNQTQAASQIDNQVNNSYDGITVFAPTDNAFKKLPAGTLNRLTVQQQVQLLLHHICPKFYSIADLQTVSNPVRTQASGQDGSVYGLYFSGSGNQVNVFDGNLEVPISIALRKDFPLAVYQLDSVLLPREFSNSSGGASRRDGSIAMPPSTSNHAGKGVGSPAAAPSQGNSVGNGARSRAVAPAPAPSGNPARNGARKMSPVGLGLVSWFGVLCISMLANSLSDF